MSFIADSQTEIIFCATPLPLFGLMVADHAIGLCVIGFPILTFSAFSSDLSTLLSINLVKLIWAGVSVSVKNLHLRQ